MHFFISVYLGQCDHHTVTKLLIEGNYDNKYVRHHKLSHMLDSRIR